MKHAMMKRAAVLPSLLLLLAGIASSAQAAPAPEQDLVLTDATLCKKPGVAPPPLVKDNADRYNARRRFIDLDGSGTCVLMDFWVERLSGSDAAGMRTLEHRFLHFAGGKWVPFETSLELFPFLLRSASTGQTYLVVAPDEDIDDIAAGGIQPAVYTRGKWETAERGMLHTYSLQPVTEGNGRIYRALAARLAQRTAPDKQTPGERQRISVLQFEAAEADKRSAPATRP